jgi:methionyl-tRNA formyltransferase
MLNVLFAGSPECAVPSLEAVARKHRVVAVLTNPAAPQGRSKELVPTPVAACAARLIKEGAIEAGTPILTPEKLTQDVRDAIAATKPDILACFAYGKIFGPKTLAIFPKGAVNVHPSLLPRWRGSTPVPAAILACDAETGITVQKMALEMDAGDIIVQTRFPLNGTETAETLLARAAAEGAPLLVESLDLLEAGKATLTKQNEADATYCSMLKKEDGEIDWTKSAKSISAQIRAFTPWPGAFTTAFPSGTASAAGEPQTLLILDAHEYAGPAGAVDRETSANTLRGVSPVGETKALREDLPSGKSSDEEGRQPGFVIGIDKKEGILVQTGEGLLALGRLQWRTKKPLDWKSFLNGTREFINSTLGKQI